jgi:SAM-dependent methyltransferase
MSCPICDCSNFETILSKPSIPIFTNAGDKGKVFNKYPCKLDQCKKCGHVFQPQSDSLRDALISVYHSDEAQLSTPLGVGNWGKDRAKYSVGRLENIEQFKNKSVLELGCGNSYVLSSLKKLGFKTLYGIDSSIETKNLNGISFIKKFITEKTQLKINFDFIFSFGVYEHVNDVNSLTTFCSNHLNDDGMIFIYVPNCYQQLKLGDPAVFSHEHVHCFVPNLIKNHLSKHGYEIVDDKTDEHAIAVYAKRVKRKKDEKQIFELFHHFQNKIDQKLQNIKNILHKGNIIIHGACSSLNNILGWIKCEFDFTLVDNDNTKHGKKYFNKKVESLNSIDIKNYNNVIILPAFFSKDIKDDYIKKGFKGKFIEIN